MTTHESGYPEPNRDGESINVDGVEYEPGDQFRFPHGTHPFSEQTKYGLCYVLRTTNNSVTFYNVTEEAVVTHSKDEIRNSELNKLDEKW